MKALDTSLLLAVLQGESGVREFVRRLHGLEIATTEANLLELAAIVAQDRTRRPTSRMEALKRLRRKLTVLPVDAHATEASVSGLRTAAGPVSPLVVGMMGALESSGCEELLTLDRVAIPGAWRFRITQVKLSHTKAR